MREINEVKKSQL